MKRFKFSVLMAIGLAVLTSACAAVDLAPIQHLKRVALIEVMVTPPPISTPFPLIQVGIYRVKLHKIASEIEQLHQDRVDKIAELLGEKLGQTLGYEVLYGNSLMKQEVFKNIEDAGIKTYPAMVDEEPFTSLALPSRGYNFFNFLEKYETTRMLDNGEVGKVLESGGNPYSLFDGKDNTFIEKHAGALASICNALGVDLIVVATATVETTRVNLIADGDKLLSMKLTFFDRNGKVAFYSHAWGERESSSGADLDGYRKALDTYPEVIDALMAQLKPD